MPTSNKEKLISNNLKITPGTKFLTAFYNILVGNLSIYVHSLNLSNRNQEMLDEILKPIFGSTLNQAEYITLANKSDVNFKNILFFNLSNISDDALCNILTTGGYIPPGTPPTEAEKAQFASAATSLYKPINNNYNTAMSYVRANQFGCTVSYTGYANEISKEFNFLTNIDPSSSGFCLGLVAFVDNNNINLDDAEILSNLIKCYCNVFATIRSNPENLKNQQSAKNYFQTFEDNYLEAVRKFVIEDEPDQSNRTGKSNAPSDRIVRPIILPYSGNDAYGDIQGNENFGNATIQIKNNDNLTVGPSGIVLNTFTQSNFNDILSILDIIRTKDDIAQIQVSQPITVKGDGEEKISSSIIGKKLEEESAPAVFKNDILPILKKRKEEINSSKKAIQDKIKLYEGELDNLIMQRNNIMKTNEFIATSIVAGFGTRADTEPKNHPKKEISIDRYVKMAVAIKNESVEAGTSSSIYSKVRSANQKTVQDWNLIFLKDLDISTDIYTPISPKTIEEVNKITNNKPPSQFVGIVGIVNKANSGKTKKNIKNICQEIINKVRATEVKKISIEKALEKIKKDYADIISA